MAALGGVKILLLWAGIIGLAKCQTSNEPGQTSNEPVHSTPAPTIECYYTVKPIEFGLQIDITSSPVDLARTSIMIKAEGEEQTEAISSAPHSNQSSSHEIKQLKPCTKYELNVTLVDYVQPTPCKRMTVNDAVTDPISEADIEVADCKLTSSKSVCYRTDWDINSLQTTPDRIPDLPCGNNIVCFKPGSDDLCSYMTLTFTSKTCNNLSFQFKRSISREFLDVKSINQTAPTRLNETFQTELPPKCDLSIDYSCRVSNHPRYFDYGFVMDNEAMKPSELEPFTNYKCTGHIKDNNVTVYNTTGVNVRIDCDLQINVTNTSTTNTSSQLTWTTTSDRCKDVIQNLPKLSYGCSCSKGHRRVWGRDPFRDAWVFKQPSGGTCSIPNLQPFTDYTCVVQPFYGRRPVSISTQVRQKTEIGVPEDIYKLTLKVKDRNTIIVTCDHSKRFNGPGGIFQAQIVYGSSLVEKNKTRCEFEFKNLNYSTSYTLQVTALNSLLHSKTKMEHISTEYDIAAKGLSVCLIILTSVALLLVVYKILELRRRKSQIGTFPQTL